MKPAPFEYSAPSSVDEALALLDDEAKVLAGGQSLVPLLNFRLARPERIVDINRIEELAYIRADEDGTLRIGALARQAELERSQLVAERWPLLAQAVRLVGHPQIRSRGTVCGSVAHADPTAELPVALTALDARFHVRSAGGSRTLRATELFAGPLTTSLAAGRAARRDRGAGAPRRGALCLSRVRPDTWRLRGGGRGRRARSRPRGRRAARGGLDAAARACGGASAGGRRGGARGRGARGGAGRRRAARRPDSGPRRPGDRGGGMRVEIEINGEAYAADVEPRTLLSDFIRHHAGLTGTKVGCEHGRVRGVHGAARRPAAALVPDARRPGRRPLAADDRGARDGAPARARLPREARAAMRLLHGGLPDVDRAVPARAPATRTRRRSARRSPATCAAARATRASWRRSSRRREGAGGERSASSTSAARSGASGTRGEVRMSTRSALVALPTRAAARRGRGRPGRMVMADRRDDVVRVPADQGVDG